MSNRFLPWLVVSLVTASSLSLARAGSFAAGSVGASAASAGGGARGGSAIGGASRGGAAVGISGGGRSGAVPGGASVRGGTALGVPSFSARSSFGSTGTGRSFPGGINTPAPGGSNRALTTLNPTRSVVSGSGQIGPARGPLGSYRSGTAVATPVTARPNNLWSERGSVGGYRNGRRGVQVNPQGFQNGAFPYDRGVNSGSYTRLDPGSYGYALRSYNDRRGDGSGRGRNGDCHDGQHHYNPGYYTSYPYYFGGGFYPLAGGYGYYGGSGFGATYLNNDASLTPDLSTYDDGSQPSLAYNPDDSNANGVPPAQPSPPARPQAPWAGEQEPAKSTSIGPDSMVEAVQEELAQRGYFKGKIDAMFRPNTREAIRRFQADNDLQPTGLLNGATLTMLGLN